MAPTIFEEACVSSLYYFKCNKVTLTILVTLKRVILTPAAYTRFIAFILTNVKSWPEALVLLHY